MNEEVMPTTSIVSGSDQERHLMMNPEKLVEMLTAELRGKRRICEYKMRLWEGPRKGYHYAIGVDPAEGLLHGDSSCIQVLCVETGQQVMEVQGIIHPFELAEICWLVGTWYNTALIAIENNKDGGSNAKLMELGYTNIYFLAEDKGLGFQEQMPKLGINMNSRRRAELISKSRNWMQDRSIILHSSFLIGQMEIFQLKNGKFQAPLGGHDDLVMAMLIACEMFEVVQLTMDLDSSGGLTPMVNGEFVELEEADIGDEWEEPEGDYVEKLIQSSIAKHEDENPEEWVTEYDNLDDMEGMW